MNSKKLDLYLVATNEDNDIADYKIFEITSIQRENNKQSSLETLLKVEVNNPMELDFAYSKFRNSYKGVGIAVVETNNNKLTLIITSNKFLLEFESVKHQGVTIGYKCVGITLKDFQEILLNLKIVSEEQIVHKIKEVLAL